MDAAAYDLRLARPGDLDALRKSVRRTLNNPEGKSQRKSFADAIGRGELLLLTRSERGQEAIEGFLEWHSRVDGGITIRDFGWAGEAPNAGHVKRMLRELLQMTRPSIATVKVEAEQQPWTQIFAETAGFRPAEREYSQRKWRQIWAWTPANDALDRQRQASQRAPAGPRTPGPRPPGARPPAPRPPTSRPFVGRPSSGPRRPVGPRR
jgi:hypothetical protein